MTQMTKHTAFQQSESFYRAAAHALSYAISGKTLSKAQENNITSRLLMALKPRVTVVPADTDNATEQDEHSLAVLLQHDISIYTRKVVDGTEKYILLTTHGNYGGNPLMLYRLTPHQYYALLPEVPQGGTFELTGLKFPLPPNNKS